jgi:alcohol dehydrogenase class IV
MNEGANLNSMFSVPARIFIGQDALAAAGDSIKKAGKKAMVVTDPTMVRIGSTGRVTRLLDEIGTQYAVYDGVTSEPTDRIVLAGKKVYLENQCDFLIAVGGGSSIDTMKAVGTLITNPGEITDYLGKIIPNPLPPTFAVPTTAGTGSEATQFTIITDTKRDIKMLLKGDGLIPSAAIVDYSFTQTTPPFVTAATGLDALCHAVEAYTSRKAQPLSDLFALDAVKKIVFSLPKAFADGSNQKARESMSLAALEAGIAFNNSSVTIIHGMSRPIGALFHVPHGLSNAMLLPNCLEFALPGAQKRFADLSEAIGACKPGGSQEEEGKAFVRAIRQLCRQLKVDTPASFGIDKRKFFESIEKMTKDALASGSPANTMRKVSADDIEAIYESLWNGGE